MLVCVLQEVQSVSVLVCVCVEVSPVGQCVGLCVAGVKCGQPEGTHLCDLHPALPAIVTGEPTPTSCMEISCTLDLEATHALNSHPSLTVI